MLTGIKEIREHVTRNPQRLSLSIIYRVLEGLRSHLPYQWTFVPGNRAFTWRSDTAEGWVLCRRDRKAKLIKPRLLRTISRFSIKVCDLFMAGLRVTRRGGVNLGLITGNGYVVEWYTLRELLTCSTCQHQHLKVPRQDNTEIKLAEW